MTRSLLLLFAGAVVINSLSADPAIPTGGLGTYTNLGLGTYGPTVVPGITALWGPFPIQGHLVPDATGWEGALSLDWLAWQQPLAGGWSIFGGPGLYGAYAGGSPGTWSTGGRLVAGARWVLLDAWEFSVAGVPAYGMGAVAGTNAQFWNADLELSLRYLFPRPKTRVVTPELPHPEVGLVPTLAAFAPGTGGPSSQLGFRVTPPTLDRVAAWTLVIVDSQGQPVTTQSGRGLPPTSLGWDGRGAAAPAPEGGYGAQLNLTYTDGSKATATSRPFAVDLSVPEVRVTLANKRFHPSVPGTDDQAVLQVVAKAKGSVASWTFRVEAPDGTEFYSTGGDGAPPSPITWDGKGTAGAFADPGRSYTYTVGVRDDLGKQQAAQGVLNVDHIHPTLGLSTDRKAFSPLGSPAELIVSTSPAQIEAVTGWKLAFLDRNNLTVREMAAQGPVPNSLSWDGKNSLGLWADGTLRARLTVSYTLGDVDQVESPPFDVVVVAPKPAVSLQAKHFLPNGDGKDETQTFALTSPGPREPASWSLSVNLPDGRPFRSWTGTGVPPSTQDFDGKGDDGSSVPLGADLPWQFSVTDDLGQTASTQGLLPVDLPRAPVVLTSPDAFSPVGTPKILTLTSEPAKIERLARWSLAIEAVGADGLPTSEVPAVTMSGTGSPKSSDLTWDGRARSGAAEDGLYRARLGLVYDRGEEAESQSPPFLLDTKPPVITAEPTAALWTPDGDGVDDDLGLVPRVKDASPAASWEFTVLDPAGNPFTTLKGTGPLPETIPWTGRSTNGELVASEQKYTWTLAVTDTVGKKSSLQGSVSTGILVVPKGNQLQLDLGGLTFLPNKADLVADQSAAGLKNAELLGKLQTVLARLAQYRVTVVGHAVNVSGTAKEEKELQVLSMARANAVKAALVKLGLDPGRLSAEGKGGTDQVVPDTDTVNRWKNRRVEFVLSK